MEKIQSFLKTHSIALAFSLVVGLLSVLPTILAPLSIGDDYKGIQFLYLNDETTYRTRIHEILDGHPGVSSPFLHEYKDELSVVPPINEYFYALPALVFGLSGAIVLSKFLFPGFLFLLLYFLVSGMLQSESRRVNNATSLAVGLLVTLGYDIVDYRKIIELFQHADTLNLLIWTRLVNPIVGALIIGGTLLFAWQAFLHESRYVYIPIGILLGVSVGYFFTLAFVYAVVGLLFVLCIAVKDYQKAKVFGLGMLIGFFIDLPYWISVFSTIGGTGGHLSATKYGMEFTHGIIINKLLSVTTVFMGLTGLYAFMRDREWMERNKKTWQFLLVLLLTCWVTLNQQILTGRAVWPHHFVQYIIPIEIIIIMVLSTLVWKRVFKKLWHLGIVLSICLSFVVGIHSATSYVFHIDEFRDSQVQYSDILQYLQNNADKDCVVLVREYDENLQRLIPGYTSCNVYDTQNVYALPQDRVLHNFLLRMRFEEVDPNHSEEYLLGREDIVRAHLFSNWEEMFGHGKDEWFLREISLVSEEYQKFSTGNLSEQIREYKVDYLYSKTALSPEMLSEVGNVSVVASSSQFILYEVR